MAAVELANGYVTLTVETSNLGRQLGRMFGGAISDANRTGRNMGQTMAKAFDQGKPDIKKLQGDVTRAQDRIAQQTEVSNRKIEAAERKVEIAKARVTERTERYGAEASQTLTAVDQLATAEQRLEAETMSASDAHDKLSDELTQAKSALADAEKSTQELGESSEEASNKYSKGWAGVKERLRDLFQNSVADASRQSYSEAEAGGREAGGFWSRAWSTAIGVGIGKIGADIFQKVSSTIKDAVASGWDRLVSIDDAEAKMRGLGYTSDEVETIMGSALKSVEGTAFGLDEAASVASNAVAAGIKPGEQLESTLTNMANSAAAAGTDMNEMGSIFNKVATSDMAQMDVINQVMDRGIPLVTTLADQFGVGADEVRKMASDGKISFEDFSKAMATASGDVAKEMGTTLTGRLSMLKSSLARSGAGLLEGIFNAAGPAIEQFTEGLKQIEPVAARIGEFLGQAFGWILQHISPIIASIVSLGAAFAAYFATVKALAMYAAIQKFFKLLKAGQLAATIQQWALNSAMLANPMGLVVAAIVALVGALVWFFTQTETGKAIWQGFCDIMVTAWQAVCDFFVLVWDTVLKPVWDGIVAVVTWVWEAVLQPVFQAIADGWNLLVTAFQIYWQNVLRPVFTAVQSVALWLWNSVLSPVFGLIKAGWNLLVTVFKLYWEAVLRPVFQAVAAVAQWLWSTILQVIFAFIKAGWQALVTGIQWYWNNVLKPSWDAMARLAQWLWQNVLSPIFGYIKNKWEDLANGIKIAYDNVIKPSIDQFGEIITGLKDKFETARKGIKQVWDKIQGVAAKPIKFVIDDVLNKGLISSFNGLMDKIPFIDAEIKKIPMPASLKPYATGGRVYDSDGTGGYTGRGHWLKPAGIVHAGEYVFTKKTTNRLVDNYGLDTLNHINRTGRLPGFADGGIVRPVTGGSYTSGFGESRGKYPHAGQDIAVPVGTILRAAMRGTVMKASWNAITGRTGKGIFLAHPGGRNTYYGHLSQIGVGVGDYVSRGQIIGKTGNTGRSTGPHLHFEIWSNGQPINPMPYLGGASVPAGGTASDGGDGGGGGNGWFDPLKPLRALADKVQGKIEKAFPEGGLPVKAAIGMGRKAYDTVIDKIAGKLGLDGATDSFTDDAAGGTLSSAFGGSKVVQGAVKNVASSYGWGSGANWNAISWIIGRESGWNPKAANPSSSARGLFQKMTSIHGPVESTVEGQARWGLNYIKDRYKNPVGAMAAWKRKGWYNTGGLVDPLNFLHSDRVLLRDRGGQLPTGTSVVNNYTGKPEWVYTDKQQDALNAALNGGSGVTVNGDVYGATPAQVVENLDRQARRRRALMAGI